MIFRSTTILEDKTGGEPISIRFCTTDLPLARGLWNIENNCVLLTESMYQEWMWIRLGTGAGQRKFFDGLEKVSDFALPDATGLPSKS